LEALSDGPLLAELHVISFVGRTVAPVPVRLLAPTPLSKGRTKPADFRYRLALAALGAGVNNLVTELPAAIERPRESPGVALAKAGPRR
jgi:hypothetical protein